jgi:hypothetical protein
MGAKPVFWTVAVGLLCAGCSVVSTATQVVTSRVKESVEDCRERHRNQVWARAAWERVCSHYPGVVFSEDYARGFEYGFTEHLYRGTVQPPPLPPAHYRQIRYQTPEGYEAIEAWFVGFRHGVGVAQAEHYRDYVTGPTSLRPAGSAEWTPGVSTEGAQTCQPAEEKKMRVRLEWTLPFAW